MKHQAIRFGYENALTMLFDFNDVIEVDDGDDPEDPIIHPIKLNETSHIIETIDNTERNGEKQPNTNEQVCIISDKLSSFRPHEEDSDEEEEEYHIPDTYFQYVGVVCSREYEWHEECYYVYCPDLPQVAYIVKSTIRMRKLGIKNWIRFNVEEDEDGWLQICGYKKIGQCYPTLEHYDVIFHEDFPDFAVQRIPTNTIKFLTVVTIPYNYKRDVYEGKVTADMGKFESEVKEIEVFDEDEVIQKGYCGKQYYATILKCTKPMRGTNVQWKLLRLQSPCGPAPAEYGMPLENERIVIETKKEKKAKNKKTSAAAIVATSISTNGATTDPTKSKFFCPTCNVGCSGEQPWDLHLKGKLHHKNEQKALKSGNVPSRVANTTVSQSVSKSGVRRKSCPKLLILVL
uniref:U1-type domain-containing protein n=1 Tax=Acrobeloides nanus TaxID=290746 RepID=A0A914E1I7_9BILA